MCTAILIIFSFPIPQSLSDQRSFCSVATSYYVAYGQPMYAKRLSTISYTTYNIIDLLYAQVLLQHAEKRLYPSTRSLNYKLINQSISSAIQLNQALPDNLTVLFESSCKMILRIPSRIANTTEITVYKNKQVEPIMLSGIAPILHL